MPLPSPGRALSRLRPSAFFALPVLLVAPFARAQECAIDDDCGPGFACEETVISAGGFAGTGGSGGSSGGGAPAGGTSSGGLAGTGSAGFPAGGSAGTTGMGGTASGGVAGTGVSGSSGAAPPPGICGNGYCEMTTMETPGTCPSDCILTTYCAPALCDTNEDCAEGYVCPQLLSPGEPELPAGCGDGFCTGAENGENCPADCPPARCMPQSGNCRTNLDCAPGYVCTFFGGSGGTGGTAGTGGAPAGGVGNAAGAGAAAGAGEGGAAGEDSEGADEAVGGTGGGAWGGGAGSGGTGTGASSGTGSIPQGGSAGIEGVCMPGGSGGPTGGTGTGTGGHGGTGGSVAGGTGGTGTGADGGSEASGGSGADGGSRSNGGSRTIVTDRGCTVSGSRGESPFGALLVAAAALFALGRRRTARRA